MGIVTVQEWNGYLTITFFSKTNEAWKGPFNTNSLLS